MEKNEVVNEVILKISLLTNELVERNGVIYFNKNLFPMISVEKYDALSNLLKLRKIDRAIINYVRHRIDREKTLELGGPTMYLDNEVSQDLSDIYKKLKHDDVLENISRWFNIYEEEKIQNESSDVLKEISDDNNKRFNSLINDDLNKDVPMGNTFNPDTDDWSFDEKDEPDEPDDPEVGDFLGMSR